MYVYLPSLKSNKETYMPCTIPEFHRNSSSSEILNVPLPDGLTSLYAEMITLLKFVLIIPSFS